jgi:hypothetical protein
MAAHRNHKEIKFMNETQTHTERPKSATAEKIALVVIISVMFITGVAFGGNQVPNIGRFQLVEGAYLVSVFPQNRSDGTRTEGTDQKVPAVFLLDSATGKVWEYKIGIDLDGKAYEYWKDVRK